MISGEHSSITQENLNIDLPVLPHTFLLAMGLSRQADHITIEEVVEVIENDPGAVARVLRVVNSAYYGLRNEVTSLHRAVVGLGPQAVLGLVMSVSLEDMKKHLHVTTSDVFNKLIRHNVAVGYLARQMASMTCLARDTVDNENGFLSEAFTLGLLHDFGKIVLFYNFPEEAVSFYERGWDIDTDAQIILKEEKEIFGIDHVEAGTYLMHELNFLSSMEMAVAAHHNFMKEAERDEGEQFLLNIVVASNKLANTVGFAFNRSISRKAFIEAPFWDDLIESQFFEETDKEILFKDLFDLKERASAYVSEIA
ncbi:MAG: HDOD domain-containing protein [Rhodothermales bacterium]